MCEFNDPYDIYIGAFLHVKVKAIEVFVERRRCSSTQEHGVVRASDKYCKECGMPIERIRVKEKRYPSAESLIPHDALFGVLELDGHETGLPDEEKIFISHYVNFDDDHFNADAIDMRRGAVIFDPSNAIQCMNAFAQNHRKVIEELTNSKFVESARVVFGVLRYMG